MSNLLSLLQMDQVFTSLHQGFTGRAGSEVLFSEQAGELCSAAASLGPLKT